MKQQTQPTPVRCVFGEEEETPKELILRSLQIFIEQNLRETLTF